MEAELKREITLIITILFNLSNSLYQRFKY